MSDPLHTKWSLKTSFIFIDIVHWSETATMHGITAAVLPITDVLLLIY